MCLVCEKSAKAGRIKRITNSSKGLIEIRKEEKTVQFIYESVNDFLLRNRRLQTLDLALKSNPIGTSYDRMRACCMSYLTMRELPLPKDRSEVQDLASSYPFLQYAAAYVLEHAEEAQAGNIEQKEFLQAGWDAKRVSLFHKLSQPFGKCWGFACGSGISLFYFSLCHKYGGLVYALLEKGTDVNMRDGPLGNALQIASATGVEKIVGILLEKGADVNAQGGFYATHYRQLQWKERRRL
ncbi:ankyrin repeat domain-containing protein [Rutstroemia sp. NJR-2017a BBW]|nr:ankyrin repeat domain-containing protein [Rutstroemia sp. NJR-2017a BBW]